MIRSLFLAVALLFCALPLAPATAQITDSVATPEDDDGPFGADDLLSFPQDIPFAQFLQYVGPLFQQRYGKQLVDPTGRLAPVGFSGQGMPFPDALRIALERAGLGLRETERYFIIGPAVSDAVSAATPQSLGSSLDLPLATDREIRIDALVFDLNLNRIREIGSDWSSVFGSQQGGQQGQQQGGQQQDRLRLFLRTRSFFDAISEIIVGPDRIDIAELNGIFRLLETNGMGRTVSAPSVSVRSGQQGRLQSGSDIPFTLRDFSGNSVTQFVSTGVIIEAVPTLLSGKDENDNDLEFIHLLISVERSNGRVTTAGVTIDKDAGSTDVLLLDGEQTILGGLYTTEESISHRGIPLLKNIPLLGNLFGVKTRVSTERELIIVLKTSLVDPLSTRLRQPPPRNLIQQERTNREARLNQTQSGLGYGREVIEEQ